MKENCFFSYKGNLMSDLIMQQIETRMAQKGIDLNLLSDQELSLVAERFLGDAPPGHLPRETVISTLQGQEPIQQWAMGIKSRVAAAAAEKMTDTTRTAVTQARTAYETRRHKDPRLAMIADKFGEWLNESNYNSAELTAMADANQDGIISNDEILNLIRTMSNAEPPSWVVDLVVKHIDADGNGSITLPEWWAFLESIGFEGASPVLDPPVPEPAAAPTPAPIPEPITAPTPAPIPEPITAPTPAPEQDALAGIAATTAAPAAVAVAATAAAVAPQAVAKPTPEPVAQPSPVVEAVPAAPASSVDPMSHEGIIEALSGARLLSEFNTIVAQSTSQTCTVKVQSTERSLMASGEYRGGQTITGVLNESEHVVAIRFPVAETEFIEGLKNGQIVTAEAVIYRWSGALKQANLEATGARIA